MPLVLCSTYLLQVKISGPTHLYCKVKSLTRSKLSNALLQSKVSLHIIVFNLNHMFLKTPTMQNNETSLTSKGI